MKLTPPKHWVFWVSVVLAVLGLAIYLFIPTFFVYGFWAMVAGYALLALGVTMTGV